ncbi:MAG TPA: hypothetical protein DCZ73_10640 [Bacteroides sp.]|nr:hypothetical protein [Phocaeicola coprophilus]HBB08193.1 hypothetical protein [Bacteroides sp.]
MKHTFYNIACMVLVALGCLCACQEDLDNASWTGDENTLLLDLETTAVQLSRSAGEDDYNENKVASADVFFFNDATGQCIYAQTGLVPDDTQLRVKLDNDKVKFGGSYRIYVIANGRSYYTDIDNTTAVGQTIAALKAKVITTAWKDGYGDTGTEIEESLLMDGEANVTISKDTPGKVQLTRAMAKVALFPTVEESIESNGFIYTPQLENMSVTMVYGVKSTKLDGAYQVQPADYVTRMLRKYADADADRAYTHVPFYSYPNPETTTDRQDTYLILCVPWSMQEAGGTQSANYYYRVPITGDADVPATLGRNQYYKVNVHVGVLGSLNPRDAVPLNGNFAIYNWFNMELSADMQHYEYLVLDEYTSVMNNENELRMPYITSSALDATNTRITKVTYKNYNDEESPSTGYTSDVTLNASQAETAGFGLTWNDDELIFTHPVTTEDYVPYTITVEVYNEQGLSATWEITQYPAIYIVGDYNPDGDNNRFIYGSNDAGSFFGGGIYDDRNNDLGGVNNPLTSGASNSNLNQYTIYITSFDIEGSNYAIGDPRSSTPDNLQYLGDEDSRGRSLTYYYPTRETDVNNVIAPAFKIASSWGVTNTNTLSYETAQRRCASYQENGYPAGRWRLPTEAEIEYIVSLSNRGVIPALFNGSYYASSRRYYDNGYYEDEPGFYPYRSGKVVRCVYDVWYWGNEKLSEKGGRDNQFVWGDEPMR